MLYRLVTTPDRDDLFSSASRAIVLGALAQVGLNNIFASDMAMVLWGFLGIGMAASQYHTHQRRLRLLDSSALMVSQL